MIGDWNIGGFVPQNIVKVDYAQKDITLQCASFKGDDGSDPMEEIMQIQAMVAYAADNSTVIQAGTVMQSYNPNQIYYITDGYESFIGIVADVIVPEDQKGDNLIQYQIKLAKYLPPKEPTAIEVLEDGDETIWDDDWECGYEKYSACNNSNNGSGSSGSGGVYVMNNGFVDYVPLQQYPEITVYKRTPIEGAAYYPGKGYIMPEGALRHTIPETINDYTIEIATNFGGISNHIASIFIGVEYVGIGTPVVGDFGEPIQPDIWDPDMQHPVLRVNSDDFEFSRASRGGDYGILRQDVWIYNIEGDSLILQVDNTGGGPFYIRHVSVPINMEETGGESVEDNDSSLNIVTCEQTAVKAVQSATTSGKPVAIAVDIPPKFDEGIGSGGGTRSNPVIYNTGGVVGGG